MASEPESLFDEIEEDAVDAMESFDDIAEMDDVDEIGDTSAEAAEPVPAAAAANERPTPRSNRLGFFKSLTIYDGMLIVSALSILIACLLLVLELSSFGGGLFYQWRTSEALVEPLTPP